MLHQEEQDRISARHMLQMQTADALRSRATELVDLLGHLQKFSSLPDKGES